MDMEKLKGVDYPGRGIVLGATPDGQYAVQLYWTMGRSENSRKRVIVVENGVVRTVPTTTDELYKADLVIYPLAAEADGLFVVSNGGQTEAVCADMAAGLSHEAAIAKWRFEHDDPIYTPRITGVTKVVNQTSSYKLSIVKPYRNDPATCLRQVFSYDNAMRGQGHCIHTYAGNGNPCPAFTGEPFIVPLFDDIDETLCTYWEALPAVYLVGMYVRYIDIITGETKHVIRNVSHI